MVRNHLDGLRRLDWIVVGGESGPTARPMEADMEEWPEKFRVRAYPGGISSQTTDGQDLVKTETGQ